MTSRKGLLVSVIIRTYNRSRYLQEAIESVLRQTYDNVELIVVDDGSTDETRLVVQRHAGKIRYLYQAHAGVSAALNAGITHATGAYLAFLDDDDLWREQLLERTVPVLEVAGNEVGVAYVGSRYFIGNDTGHLIDPGWTGRSGDLFDALIENNFIPINAVLIRRRCLEAVGGCDPALGGYEDWDLFLRIALAGFAYRYLDDQLALIRLHPAHQRSDTLMMKRDALAVVSKLSRTPGVSPERQRLIRRALARRHLSLGWHLILQDHREEGAKELCAASPVGFVQMAQKQTMLLLASLLGTVSLRRINGVLEAMSKQKSI
jgi:glycosyltransferase involved in cell wall biosynthesis